MPPGSRHLDQFQSLAELQRHIRDVHPPPPPDLASTGWDGLGKPCYEPRRRRARESAEVPQRRPRQRLTAGATGTS
eukprot:1774862-Pyramimonas_sp.AAC.1